MEIREARGFKARAVTPACLGSKAIVPSAVSPSANNNLYRVYLSRLDHASAEATGETTETVFAPLDFDEVHVLLAHACIFASPHRAGQRRGGQS
jgi:hypothetical protein